MPHIVGSRHAPLLVSVIVAAVVALAVAGCVASQATPCGGLICPTGRACSNGTCVEPSLLTACARLLDGDACTVPEIGAGACHAGLCQIGVCGDGAINGIDACDGADLAGKTCLDFGSTDAKGLACTADCSYDVSKCTARCGDGVKDSAEQCDGKDFAGKTCITEGYYGGDLACTDACEINPGGCRERCGDGVRNGLEQCDGTDFGGSTCAMRGFPGAVSPLLCDATCGLDLSSCLCGVERCVMTTEQCVMTGSVFTCEAKP
jgi:hypothetical protein